MDQVLALVRTGDPAWLVPTPGGLGAVEAATIAGLTAIGIAPTDAVAAARLLTYWLPVLPGIVVFWLLQHRRVI